MKKKLIEYMFTLGTVQKDSAESGLIIFNPKTVDRAKCNELARSVGWNSNTHQGGFIPSLGREVDPFVWFGPASRTVNQDDVSLLIPGD